MNEKIIQTAGKNQLGEFAPDFALSSKPTIKHEAERHPVCTFFLKCQKVIELFSCPDVHFICTAFPGRTSCKAWIASKLVIFDGIIHDSRHLVIDGLQIRLGIRTAAEEMVLTEIVYG